MEYLQNKSPGVPAGGIIRRKRNILLVFVGGFAKSIQSRQQVGVVANCICIPGREFAGFLERRQRLVGSRQLPQHSAAVFPRCCLLWVERERAVVIVEGIVEAA